MEAEQRRSRRFERKRVPARPIFATMWQMWQCANRSSDNRVSTVIENTIKSEQVYKFFLITATKEVFMFYFFTGFQPY